MRELTTVEQLDILREAIESGAYISIKFYGVPSETEALEKAHHFAEKMKSEVVQGSNDGANWVDVKQNSNLEVTIFHREGVKARA